jgi:hypothetical protein
MRCVAGALSTPHQALSTSSEIPTILPIACRAGESVMSDPSGGRYDQSQLAETLDRLDPGAVLKVEEDVLASMFDVASLSYDSRAPLQAIASFAVEHRCHSSSIRMAAPSHASRRMMLSRRAESQSLLHRSRIVLRAGRVRASEVGRPSDETSSVDRTPLLPMLLPP